jgi:hypothetical protein
MSTIDRMKNNEIKNNWNKNTSYYIILYYKSIIMNIINFK